MEKFLAAVAARPELFTSDFSNQDKYPVLAKVDKNDNAVKWWNKLSIDDRQEVGGVAIHYNLMTANFRWRRCEFELLSKRQKNIVKTCFSKRNNTWAMIPIESLI